MRPALRPPWPLQTSLLPWLPPTSPHHIPRRIATTSAQNAAPVDIPKLVVTPGSTQHNSLASYLDYVKRKGLTTRSTTYVGTQYEYLCALALMRLGFSLLRTGAKNDAGIDLIGHWVLAPLREPLRVILQCKAWKNGLNPATIRELEGSFPAIPPDWKGKDVLGLLVSTQKASKGILQALGQSTWPLGFVMILHDGTVQQFVWNRAAAERGLEGVGVTVRHTPRALIADQVEEQHVEPTTPKKTNKRLAKFKNAGTRKDIQLTWMGSPIFPDRESLDQETVELMRCITPSDADIPTPSVRPRRGRRPRIKEETDETTIVTKPRGRPKGSIKLVHERMPRPRGGLIPKPRTLVIETRGRRKKVVKAPVGRPKGSKNKHQKIIIKRPPGRPPWKKWSLPEPPEPIVKRPRGRPPKLPPVKRLPGRPKGSKNKPKVPVDTG